MEGREGSGGEGWIMAIRLHTVKAIESGTNLNEFPFIEVLQ